MKKSFLLFRRSTLYKLGILPILMTFLFVAAMQVDMNAQQRTDGSNMQQYGGNNPGTLYFLPTGNFVTSPVAQERLKAKLVELKDQLAQYPEGSAPYRAALLRFKYYNGINESLIAGKTVAESIVAGLSAVSTTTDPASVVSADTLLAEKNTAIALLRP